MLEILKENPATIYILEYLLKYSRKACNLWKRSFDLSSYKGPLPPGKSPKQIIGHIS